MKLDVVDPYCECWVCAGPSIGERWGRRILIGLGSLLVLLLLSLGGCYATTGPKPPTCSMDPSQPQCVPPLQDERK